MLYTVLYSYEMMIDRSQQLPFPDYYNYEDHFSKSHFLYLHFFQSSFYDHVISKRTSASYSTAFRLKAQDLPDLLNVSGGI